MHIFLIQNFLEHIQMVFLLMLNLKLKFKEHRCIVDIIFILEKKKSLCAHNKINIIYIFVYLL